MSRTQKHEKLTADTGHDPGGWREVTKSRLRVGHVARVADGPARIAAGGRLLVAAAGGGRRLVDRLGGDGRVGWRLICRVHLRLYRKKLNIISRKELNVIN